MSTTIKPYSALPLARARNRIASKILRICDRMKEDEMSVALAKTIKLLSDSLAIISKEVREYGPEHDIPERAADGSFLSKQELPRGLEDVIGEEERDEEEEEKDDEADLGGNSNRVSRDMEGEAALNGKVRKGT